MKILFIGMPFSIHTVRWINQLADAQDEIHFFSSFPYSDIHQDFRNIIFHDFFHSVQTRPQNSSIKYRPVYNFEVNIKACVYKKFIGKLFRFIGLENSRESALIRIINRVRPDIIHTLETQHAGYLVSNIWEKLRNKPVWIHSTWGIDLHLFKNLDEHNSKIRYVLNYIDNLIVEGNRDIEFAKELGFNKHYFIFPSVGGGFDLKNIPESAKPSKRTIILLKGAQDTVRRGLFGLRALERCIDLLDDYEIIVYNCSEPLLVASQIFNSKYKKRITIINDIPHSEMITLSCKARISITNNISDGLPNTMLEAMLTGAFPIQSNTSCADEWIKNGENGFLVHPEDPEEIEKAIRKALLNDNLVDKAAEINFKLISEKLEKEVIKNKTIAMYKTIISKKE